MTEVHTRTMGKRVTAADVARSLGLSRATVGFVLNDTPGQKISEATKQRVVAEAKRLGYRPHPGARALARGRSHIVLLVLPDWPLDHSLRVHLDEASLALDRAGYSLVATTPHPDGQAQPLWDTLDPAVVVAFAPLPDAQYDAIVASGAKTLVPGRGEAFEILRELGPVEGPSLQVSRLVERGCRRIAFAGAGDPRVAQLVAQRRELAAATVRELLGVPLAGVACPDAEGAGAVLEDWLAAGVDGVVAYNDDVAALMVSAAVRRGVRMPDDLAVIGHDDTPLASLTVPSLTTVRVDVAGLGRYLAELALSAVEGAEHPVSRVHVRAALVVRESA